MNRKRFIAVGLGAGIGLPLAAVGSRASGGPESAALPERPLPVPPDGIIRAAVAIGPGTNVIDMSGPWEVFQDAVVAGGAGRFELYTVAEDTSTVEATGGLRIEPTYSYRRRRSRTSSSCRRTSRATARSPG